MNNIGISHTFVKKKIFINKKDFYEDIYKKVKN